MSVSGRKENDWFGRGEPAKRPLAQISGKRDSFDTERDMNSDCAAATAQSAAVPQACAHIDLEARTQIDTRTVEASSQVTSTSNLVTERR
jgi:hypothetical protein